MKRSRPRNQVRVIKVILDVDGQNWRLDQSRNCLDLRKETSCLKGDVTGRY